MWARAGQPWSRMTACQLDGDLGGFDILARRFGDHRGLGGVGHRPVIHLDGEGEGPAVVEFDLAAPVSGAAADVGVDVGRLELGDTDVHGAPGEGEAPERLGPAFGVRSSDRSGATSPST